MQQGEPGVVGAEPERSGGGAESTPDSRLPPTAERYGIGPNTSDPEGNLGSDTGDLRPEPVRRMPNTKEK